MKRDVEIEKLTIVVKKEKIKKKMLREINDELEKKIWGKFCELAACFFCLNDCQPKRLRRTITQ